MWLNFKSSLITLIPNLQCTTNINVLTLCPVCVDVLPPEGEPAGDATPGPAGDV